MLFSKLARVVKQIPAGFRALVSVWKANLGSTLRERFQSLHGVLSSGRFRLDAQSATAKWLAGAIALVGTLPALGWMLHRTHSELVALDALYARSWAAQMREMDGLMPNSLEHFHA